MSRVPVVATLVDGSVFETSVARSDFDRAVHAGLAGRALIVELLGDDVRPAPRFVDFSGVASDDRALSMRVMFD